MTTATFIAPNRAVAQDTLLKIFKVLSGDVTSVITKSNNTVLLWRMEYREINTDNELRG